MEARQAVVPTDDPHDNEIEEASARLEESLRNCRSVVNDYWQLLSNSQSGLGDRTEASDPLPPTTTD